MALFLFTKCRKGKLRGRVIHPAAQVGVQTLGLNLALDTGLQDVGYG